MGGVTCPSGPMKRSGLKSSASAPYDKKKINEFPAGIITATYIDRWVTVHTPRQIIRFLEGRKCEFGLHHMLARQIVPFGMKNPSYQSSWKRGKMRGVYCLSAGGGRDSPLWYNAVLLRHHLWVRIYYKVHFWQ